MAKPKLKPAKNKPQRSGHPNHPAFLRAIRRILILTVLAAPAFYQPTAFAAVERENAVVRAVRKISPAVVNIGTEAPVQSENNPFADDPLFNWFFRDFYEPRQKRRTIQRQSLGSGVIIDGNRGFILTNNHVIAQAGRITVTLNDEREFEAQVVGADQDSDLAILRIDSKSPLPAVEMGDSGDLMIGEDVIAIGNPFGFSHTVTRGVISALNRSIRAEDTTYHDFIQTDASINPGNSGGPLLNINGDLIGINTAIYARAQGIGFAIPINKARRVVSDLIQYGEVSEIWLGVTVQEVSESVAQYLGVPPYQGVLVRKVDPDSPAQKAGIREGDVLTAIGGIQMHSVADFNAALRGYSSGETARVILLRQGKTQKCDIRVAAFPQDRAAEMAFALLGVQVRDTQDGSGVAIARVQPQSFLAQVGVRPGDVILQIDETPTQRVADFERAAIRYRNKGSVVILLQRGKRAYYITVKL